MPCRPPMIVSWCLQSYTQFSLGAFKAVPKDAQRKTCGAGDQYWVGCMQGMCPNCYPVPPAHNRIIYSFICLIWGYSWQCSEPNPASVLRDHFWLGSSPTTLVPGIKLQVTGMPGECLISSLISLVPKYEDIGKCTFFWLWAWS